MIILNDSNKLNDMAKEMRESAIKFYGKKYTHAIDKVIRETFAYEFDEEPESLAKAIHESTGINEAKSKEFVDNFPGKIRGCHFTKPDLSVLGKPKLKRMILIRNENDYVKMTEILVHELYGHGVCSVKRPYIKLNNEYYYRNGIAYESSNGFIDNIANEGFIELFATLITQLRYPEYKINKETYAKATEVANLIYEYEGHDKIIDIVAGGKGAISTIFDPNDTKKWAELSQLLEKGLLTAEYDDEIDEMLDGYVKRKKYNR